MQQQQIDADAALHSAHAAAADADAATAITYDPIQLCNLTRSPVLACACLPVLGHEVTGGAGEDGQRLLP